MRAIELYFFVSLSLKKSKNLKYLPSALAPAPNVGTMGTTDPTMRVGYRVDRDRAVAAGKLFVNFDFRIRQNHVLEPRFRIEFASSSRGGLRGVRIEETT